MSGSRPEERPEDVIALAKAIVDGDVASQIGPRYSTAREQVAIAAAVGELVARAETAEKEVAGIQTQAWRWEAKATSMAERPLKADLHQAMEARHNAEVERDAAVARAETAERALRQIAESGGTCVTSLVGGCVGATQSRRVRFDNPERHEVVTCPKHFAESVLAVVCEDTPK